MKNHGILRTGSILSLFLFLLGWCSLESADLKSLVKDVFPVPSITGNEEQLARKVRDLLPKSFAVEADGLGGFAVRLGKGEPKLVVIAALDGYGFFVSGITSEGYLTLDRAVPPPHAQFDAYLLGQPVLVSTRNGPVPGVVAQPAMHLLTQERRRALVENFSLENAFVDIGVRSEKEARDKGLEILDAVTFWPLLTELAAERWAGPSLGLKAACAALISAAADLAKARPAGETILVWAAQTKFAARGRGPRASLGALRAKNRWRPQRTIILDIVAAEKGAAPPGLGKGPVLVQAKDAPTPLRQGLERSAGAGRISVQYLAGAETPLVTAFGDPDSDVLTVALPVQFIHTPSEIIDLKDVQALCDLLGRFLKTGGER
jgi:putative aminopeptidase FrvX